MLSCGHAYTAGPEQCPSRGPGSPRCQPPRSAECLDQISVPNSVARVGHESSSPTRSKAGAGSGATAWYGRSRPAYRASAEGPAAKSSGPNQVALRRHLPEARWRMRSGSERTRPSSVEPQPGRTSGPEVRTLRAGVCGRRGPFSWSRRTRGSRLRAATLCLKRSARGGRPTRWPLTAFEIGLGAASPAALGGASRRVCGAG